MRTLLSRFSEDFVRSLDPLLAPLDEAAARFAAASGDLPGRDVHAELREIHHHLRVLVDKVADQHAFVLIFGPLKSGKSTLMNAISAAYVSEVTSLPAYPCMVHVSHSDARGFTITRYDGETETASDAASLHMIVQRAHAELADAIRRTEEAGDQFEPSTHFPQAIRKVDVRMPAGALKESGAELVDTPGLYSRMKFGYDRMTRDFRNVAACAIFVVKSDNLFLEQVFEEFSELLDLFSRIFLVVNVDSTKMDLGPKGELVPSLEQEDPLRIVEAFENYSMSVPLKRAAEEGRLRIYPIDLLQAASRRLADVHAAPLEEGSEEAEAGAADHEEEAYKGHANFQSFLEDLSQFLNSTDYLVAFINDSLRRADTLLDELQAGLERDSVRQLGDRLSELRRHVERTKRCRAAVTKLEQFGWEAAFDNFEQKLGALVRERVRIVSEKTSDELDRALDAWFETDASLQDLLDGDLLPLLGAYQEELAEYVQETLMREASGVAGGIRVTPEVTDQLRLADVRADELARAAIESVQGAIAPVALERPFATADVPIQKRFLDWVLFRTQGSIRRKLLGPPERPSVRLSKGDKQTRLGAPARQAMKRAIDRYKGEFFPAASERIRESVLAQYAAAMSSSLLGELGARAQELDARAASLDKQVAEHALVHGRLTDLEKAHAEARQAVVDLGHLHGEAVPDLILHPASPEDSGPEIALEEEGDATAEVREQATSEES